MYFWKLLNKNGSVRSLETHSNPHPIPGAELITEKEWKALFKLLFPSDNWFKRLVRKII